MSRIMKPRQADRWNNKYVRNNKYTLKQKLLLTSRANKNKVSVVPELIWFGWSIERPFTEEKMSNNVCSKVTWMQEEKKRFWKAKSLLFHLSSNFTGKLDLRDFFKVPGHFFVTISGFGWAQENLSKDRFSILRTDFRHDGFIESQKSL